MRAIDSDKKTRHAGTSLSEYWRRLWKKKHFIIVPVFLSASISVVGVRFLRPVYMSASLVRMEDENYLSDEVAQLVTVQERRLALDEELLARIRAEIESSGFVDELIAHLGLADNPQIIAEAKLAQQTRYPDLTVNEILHRRLRGILKEKMKISLSGPGMFQLACHDYNPETCYKLADAVTTLFIESQRRKQLRGLEEASEFSDEQVEVYKKRLEQSEREMEQLQERITDLALQSNPVGESSAAFAETFGGESNLRYAETLKEQLDIRVIELEEVVGRIRGRLQNLMGSAPVSAEVSQDPEIVRLKKSLISQRETQLRVELGARGVTETDQEASLALIETVEQSIQRRLTAVVDFAFSETEKDFRPLIVEYYLQSTILESVKAKRDRLISYINAFKRKLDVTPQLELQLAKLTEQVKTDRELYNSFLRAKTSAQISVAVQNTNLGIDVEVIEPAVRPLTPVRPKRMRVLLLALMIGVTVGVGGLLVSEYTDTSFRTIEEVEQRLELRVLGTVPSIDKSSGWNRERGTKHLVIWVTTCVLVVFISLAGFYIYGKMANKLAISGTTRAETQGAEVDGQ